MMGGKGKGYSTIIFLCIVVGIPLYILGNYMTPILIIGAIILVIAIVTAIANQKDQSKQLENIVSVELIGRTNVYKEGFENTGFSIGTSGHGRAYFGKRKRLQGVEATFYVRYSDKSPKTISVMEGTEHYFKLLSYLGQNGETPRNKERKAQPEPEPKIQEQQTEQSEKFASLEEIKTPPKILEVPFEVLPNEYSIEVRHQSCIYKRTEYDNGRYEVDVRCEVHYDPMAKGVTNRRVVISLYDSKGRIFAIRNTYPQHLDKSGCQVVEINFWQDIYEEPSKVSISVEKCL